MESLSIIQWCLDHLNYWTITLLMAIESSFIPFPSEVVVAPAAWMATGEGSMNIFLVVFFATLGADIGALVNYYLSMWLGRPIIYKFSQSKIGKALLLSPEKVQKAEAYFDKNGVISTLIGRLIPGIRQLISIPAGLAKMKIGPFLLYTTIGAGIWNTILALLGYSLAKVPGIKTKEELIRSVTTYSHEIGYIFIVILLLALFVWLIRKSVKRKKKVQ